MDNFIDRFEVLLLDMGGTFMFDADNFGESEDYHATYRSVGGGFLDANTVRRIVGSAFERLNADYQDPAMFEHFPQVIDYLRDIPNANDLSEFELGLLESVFALHELGTIPTEYVNALHRLRKTHRLGIVSNVWARGGIFLDALERAGVRDLFDTIVFSSEHGCVKPSPRLFEAALAEISAERASVAYVGDSFARDVVGAKGVGLSAIWIDAEGAGVPGTGPQPDHVIGDLRDLVE